MVQPTGTPRTIDYVTVALSGNDQRALAEQVCTVKEAAALDLVDVRGMTLRAAAHHLGISLGALRDRLASGRKKIHRYVVAEFPGGRACASPESRAPASALRIAIALLVERDGPLCYLCRRMPAAGTEQIDHIIPKAHGGTDDPANLALACSDCNARKGPQFVSLRTSSGRPVYHPPRVI